jgi:hypothetical protein
MSISAMNIHEIKRYPASLDGETLAIGTAGELAIALDVLNGTSDRVLLEQLAPHLGEIISDSAGLMLVFKSLSTADQIFLVGTLGAQLTTIIGSAQALRDLLSYLADTAVEQKIIATLGSSGLRALIHHVTELSQILHWVYEDADNQVLTLLGADYVRRMVHNGYELSLMLDTLHDRGEREFIEMLGYHRIKQLISDGRDLAYVLRAVPSEEGAKILDEFTSAELVALIGNANDWAFLWKQLEPTEAELLATKLGVDAYAA